MQDSGGSTGVDAGGRRTGVQSIARAGRVLRALEQSPGGVALGDLASTVELPKSTVHRIVAALAAEELVSSVEGGGIVLGSGLTRLASASRRTLPERLHPLLERVHGELQETIDLAVLDGEEMLFVDQIAAHHRLRAVSAVGERFPLHCTANGKALLAALDREDAAALLPARLPRMTAATITSRPALLRELDQIRALGVAFDREEHTEGICAVGVAISDGSGAIAALSVPVPTQRFAACEQRCVRALESAGEEASRLLGAA